MKRVQRIKVGNKDLSLNDVWRLCLKMWKFVVKNIGPEKNKWDMIDGVENLKRRWCLKNGFKSLDSNCFFCAWAVECSKEATLQFWAARCTTCPGKLADRKFDCFNWSYRYSTKPHAFYKKLLKLNKKRQEKKGK